MLHMPLPDLMIFMI